MVHCWVQWGCHIYIYTHIHIDFDILNPVTQYTQRVACQAQSLMSNVQCVLRCLYLPRGHGLPERGLMLIKAFKASHSGAKELMKEMPSSSSWKTKKTTKKVDFLG